MKLKLGIIYTILIWFVYLITVIFSHLTDNIPYINVAPIAITVSGFFGILYIRDIDENEIIRRI